MTVLFSDAVPSLAPLTPLTSEADLAAARIAVARILHRVYWEEWTPLQGLARWPYASGIDLSIDVAFQALAYLEADEDHHAADPYWLDTQLQWIAGLIAQLSTGLPLPARVLTLYSSQLVTSPYWEAPVLFQPLIRLQQWCRAQLKVVRTIMSAR